MLLKASRYITFLVFFQVLSITILEQFLKMALFKLSGPCALLMLMFSVILGTNLST